MRLSATNITSLEFNHSNVSINGAQPSKNSFGCIRTKAKTHEIEIGGKKIKISCDADGIWIRGQEDLWIGGQYHNAETTYSIISKFIYKDGVIFLNTYSRDYLDDSWVCYGNTFLAKKNAKYCKSFKVRCRSRLRNYKQEPNGKFVLIKEEWKEPKKGSFIFKHDQIFYTYCGKSKEFMNNLGND